MRAAHVLLGTSNNNMINHENNYEFALCKLHKERNKSNTNTPDIVYSCKLLFLTQLLLSSTNNPKVFCGDTLNRQWSRWLCKMIIWHIKESYGRLSNVNSCRLFTHFFIRFFVIREKVLFCQAINERLLNFVWKFSTEIPLPGQPPKEQESNSWPR